jgi:hypothetical protein
MEVVLFLHLLGAMSFGAGALAGLPILALMAFKP